MVRPLDSLSVDALVVMMPGPRDRAPTRYAAMSIPPAVSRCGAGS